jgi:hypothetical protein
MTGCVKSPGADIPGSLVICVFAVNNNAIDVRIVNVTVVDGFIRTRKSFLLSAAIMLNSRGVIRDVQCTRIMRKKQYRSRCMAHEITAAAAADHWVK